MLTDDDMDIIVAALPGDLPQPDAALLGRILREWARVELPEHLTYEERAFTQAERKNLDRVRTAALELTTALNSLSKRESGLLRYKMGEHKPPEEASRRLGCIQEAISEVAEVAGAAVTALTRRRGRSRAIIPYLLMMDLADMFEFATGHVATRLVRGEDHPEYGREYGDFWNFARAAWIAVFKSEKGLRSAIRNWAGARKKYGERSPLIANLNLRHPEWGIFDREQ